MLTGDVTCTTLGKYFIRKLTKQVQPVLFLQRSRRDAETLDSESEESEPQTLPMNLKTRRKNFETEQKR